VTKLASRRAAFETYRGENHQGGSTLTMQLARMIYGLNTRSVPGKLRQIASALWLEKRYSKRELLEAYLNLARSAETFRASAASRIYLGKAPAQVTLGEALTLAVIPQRPSIRAGRSVQESSVLSARDVLSKRAACCPRETGSAVHGWQIIRATMPIGGRSSYQWCSEVLGGGSLCHSAEQNAYLKICKFLRTFEEPNVKAWKISILKPAPGLDRGLADPLSERPNR
jgi:hypothetical protein